MKKLFCILLCVVLGCGVLIANAQELDGGFNSTEARAVWGDVARDIWERFRSDERGAYIAVTTVLYQAKTHTNPTVQTFGGKMADRIAEELNVIESGEDVTAAKPYAVERKEAEEIARRIAEETGAANSETLIEEIRQRLETLATNGGAQ